MNCLKKMVMICMLTSSLYTAAANAAHMYYIGVVGNLSNNQIVVDGKGYQLSPKVKVILRTLNNGAIHEEKGRLSDVNVGNNITVKAENGIVTEIEKIVSR